MPAPWRKRRRESGRRVVTKGARENGRAGSGVIVEAQRRQRGVPVNEAIDKGLNDRKLGSMLGWTAVVSASAYVIRFCAARRCGACSRRRGLNGAAYNRLRDWWRRPRRGRRDGRRDSAPPASARPAPTGLQRCGLSARFRRAGRVCGPPRGRLPAGPGGSSRCSRVPSTAVSSRNRRADGETSAGSRHQRPPAARRQK
jgi:hypothetical protein